MGNGTTEVLAKVADNTHSDLISFFIILAVVILVIGLPLYVTNRKDKKDARRQHNESQQQLITVIQENTAVNSQLKTLLETNNTNCAQCRIDHQEKLDVLGDKIDSHNDKIVEVATLLKQKQII